MINLALLTKISVIAGVELSAVHWALVSLSSSLMFKILLNLPTIRLRISSEYRLIIADDSWEKVFYNCFITALSLQSILYLGKVH